MLPLLLKVPPSATVDEDAEEEEAMSCETCVTNEEFFKTGEDSVCLTASSHAWMTFSHAFSASLPHEHKEPTVKNLRSWASCPTGANS